MPGRDERSRAPWIVTVLGLALTTGPADPLAARDATRIEVGGAAEAGINTIVSTAVRDAFARLSNDACTRIFSDYRDSSGRTLQDNLESLGQTGSGYLAWLNFYDGNGKTRCADRGTLASTSPGSRVVYICSPQFMEKQRRDPGLTAALIIHETLHSLGLAENPPSSQAITAQVISRCGK